MFQHLLFTEGLVPYWKVFSLVRREGFIIPSVSVTALIKLLTPP